MAYLNYIFAVYFNNKTLTTFKNASQYNFLGKKETRKAKNKINIIQLPQQSNCHKYSA